MKLIKVVGATVLMLASAIGVAAVAQAEVRVGVITSGTGPMSLIGIPQKNTVALLPNEIGGHPIRYITIDDRSDPTATVTAFKKLVTEEKVDVVIGPSGSPNAMAIIPFAAESNTPVLTLVGGAAVVVPMSEEKKWMFKPSQNDDLIAQALVDHMAASQIKTVGLIVAADAFGESWSTVMTRLANDKGIKIVALERFQRQDTSVTGQSLRVRLAKPDAVLVAAPGAAAVLPQATLRDHGYKGTIYQTHGAAMDGFLQLGGAKVEGTILAASLMLVVNEISDSHPAKKIALKYIKAYHDEYGQLPATFGAAVYDSGLLLQRAVPVALSAATPGTQAFRSALRDALESTVELPGTQGVYNVTAADHSGFDERGRVLIEVRDGKWRLLSE